MMMWHDVLQFFFPFFNFLFFFFCFALLWFFMCQQNEKQNADHFDNNISFSFIFLFFNEPAYVSIMQTKICGCYYDVSDAQVSISGAGSFAKILSFLLKTRLAVGLMPKHKISVINSLQLDYNRSDCYYFLCVLSQRSVRHLGFDFAEYFYKE